jgi:hypothetical protein
LLATPEGVVSQPLLFAAPKGALRLLFHVVFDLIRFYLILDVLFYLFFVSSNRVHIIPFRSEMPIAFLSELQVPIKYH